MKNLTNSLTSRTVKLIGAAATLVLLIPISTSGQQFQGNITYSPIVVELFTSQSCASCPPAETFLTNVLRNMESVVPLAMHVDYWNYLGWTDQHSDAAFTERQQSYANAAEMPFIFTPQIVIQGQHLIAGHAENRINEIINTLRNSSDQEQQLFWNPEQVEGGFEVKLVKCSDAGGKYIVQRVLYSDKEIESVVLAGENKGQSWIHSNVVNDLLEIEWDGRSRFDIEENYLNTGGDTSIVLLLQEVVKEEGYHGPIITSLRLKNDPNDPFEHLRISYSDEYGSDCVNFAAAN